MAVRAVRTGVWSTSVDWQQISSLLSGVADDHPDLVQQAARIARDGLSQGDVSPVEVQSLLTDLMENGSSLARLSVLIGVYTHTSAGGNAFKAWSVLEMGLNDTEAGLRSFTLQIIETEVTSGTVDDQRLATLLKSALADSHSAVGECAAAVTGTAITHQVGDTSHLHSLLVDVVTEETAASQVRRAAVDEFVAVHDTLDMNETYLETLSAAASAGSKTIRQAAIEGAGRLLMAGITMNDPTHPQLTRLLWTGLDDRDHNVRQIAADWIATARRKGAIDGSSENAGGIERALAEGKTSAASRTALAELLVETTRPIDPAFER
jgi:hypothetical protein